MIGFVLGAFLIGASAEAVGSSPNFFVNRAFQLGQEIRKAQAHATGTALIVDGMPVSRLALDAMTASVTTNGAKRKDSEAVARPLVIRNALAAREAAKRGFLVTDAELDGWIARQRADLATMPADAKAADAALLAGLKKSDAEYWATPGLRDSIRMSLAIAKFRAAVGKSAFDAIVDAAIAVADVKDVSEVHDVP